MDASAAKLIGAGLATIALAGVGVGIGNIFGSFVSGALRNPEAAPACSATCCWASRSPKPSRCSRWSSPS